MKRKKKRIKIGRLLIVLLLAVLIFCGIYFIQHKVTNNKTEEHEQTVSKKEDVPIPDDVSINMTVTGDVLCHNTNFWDAYYPATDSYDFSYSFEGIKKYFESADICVGTLESNFAGKAARI